VYSLKDEFRIYPYVFRGKLILMITHEKAKNILGDYGKKLNDKQVQTILNFLYGLCEKIIEMEVKKQNILL